MKKICWMVLALILMAMVACGGEENTTKSTVATEEETQAGEANDPETTAPLTTEEQTTEEPTTAVQIVEIPITMENWDQYFEIREGTTKYKDPFGEYTKGYVYEGIFLKEEYLNKLSNRHPVEVAFEVQCDKIFKVITIDPKTGEISISEESYDFSEYGDRLVCGVITGIISVFDYRNGTIMGAESDEEGNVVAVGLGGGSFTVNGLETRAYCTNTQVLRVTGSIFVYE